MLIGKAVANSAATNGEKVTEQAGVEIVLTAVVALTLVTAMQRRFNAENVLVHLIARMN